LTDRTVIPNGVDHVGLLSFTLAPRRTAEEYQNDFDFAAEASLA
jgi:hypothetical protein